MIRLAIAALIAALALPGLADARIPRSAAAKNAFERANPCPATGQPRGPCPGYIVDHVNPLCNGGADAPANMQWQTTAEAKAKDREERRMCARK